MPEKKWTIDITPPYGGFAPAYWEETYPYYGNKNMAGAMTDIDITSPDRLTQGPGLADLTNGTQADAVTTLIKHISNIPTADGVTWAVGENLLYKTSNTTVTDDGNYPHTIDKAAVTGEDAEAVVPYNGFVYYFYNHSGSAGDFGRLTIATDTFDDDFGSTIPATGAAALNDAPHPAILGGDGIIYFGNGSSVGYYDPVTDVLSTTELDLPSDVEVVDLVWEKNVIWIATNSPNISTGNTNRGVIYVWDTVSASFQEPIIEVPGRLGALFVKNGRVFVFYQDLSSTGGYKLGYIVGDTVQELVGFTGSLPTFGQVTHFKNMIAFVSSGQVYLWGATSNKVSTALSQYVDGGHATTGAIGSPFGSLLIASDDGGGNSRLAKPSGFSTSAAWNTIMYDTDVSVVDQVKVYYYTLANSARADFSLRYNRGASTLSLGNISTSDSGVSKSFYPQLECEDFRLEIDWSNGDATDAAAIRKVRIIGHHLKKD